MQRIATQVSEELVSASADTGLHTQKHFAQNCYSVVLSDTSIWIRASIYLAEFKMQLEWL